jgi:sugar phosphate isomerase/epimerase
MAELTLAAKCAPREEIFSDIEKAGIGAVEIYLSGEILKGLPEAVELCARYPFRYALHAPNDAHEPERLAEFAHAVGAEVIVFHNVYFEDEWEHILGVMGPLEARLCVENVSSILEPLKFMRRFGLGMCLDLEHLQIECAGVYEEVFIEIIGQASHVHLTGYAYGSSMWHTHIHHSPEHGAYLLALLMRAGYSGWVVSEARPSLQNHGEFLGLKDFMETWRSHY